MERFVLVVVTFTFDCSIPLEYDEMRSGLLVDLLNIGAIYLFTLFDIDTNASNAKSIRRPALLLEDEVGNSILAAFIAASAIFNQVTGIDTLEATDFNCLLLVKRIPKDISPLVLSSSENKLAAQ